jgi:hypothetical protein
MKITNWKDCIRNRPKWKEFVEKTKTSPNLQRLKKKKKTTWRSNLMQLPTFSNNNVFKNYLTGLYNQPVLTVW